MEVTLTFRPIVAEFSSEERDAWVAGDREDCIDHYCRGIGGGAGIGGFGEFIAGKYWQERGYSWVHHDFDIIAANKKVYASQPILENALGERLPKFKATCQSLWPFSEEHHGPLEQPDLLIHKPGTAEIRFAECKRHGTRDMVNPRQALGLFLIASLLHVPVDICVVAEGGTCVEPLPPITFTVDESVVLAGAPRQA